MTEKVHLDRLLLRSIRCVAVTAVHDGVTTAIASEAWLELVDLFQRGGGLPGRCRLYAIEGVLLTAPDRDATGQQNCGDERSGCLGCNDAPGDGDEAKSYCRVCVLEAALLHAIVGLDVAGPTRP